MLSFLLFYKFLAEDNYKIIEHDKEEINFRSLTEELDFPYAIKLKGDIKGGFFLKILVGDDEFPIPFSVLIDTKSTDLIIPCT